MAGLNGKIALVTGASRGIGAAIARRLAGDGARVIAHYGSKREEAEALARETGAALAQADLASLDGPARLAAQIEGPLDIVVHNAGVVTMVPLDQQTVEDFDRQFAINVRAPLFLTQALAPRINDGGRVILLSSVVARAHFGNGALVAYSATKGAVNTMVVHLAEVFGPRAVTVNAVAPGVIATDMNPWLDEPGGPDAATAGQAIKRVGQPPDIADVVAFLASADSRWVTGQVIEASGGTKL